MKDQVLTGLLTEGEQMRLCQKLRQEGRTPEHIAAAFLRSEAWVAGTLRLYEESPDLAALVARGVISRVTAFATLHAQSKITEQEKAVYS